MTNSHPSFATALVARMCQPTGCGMCSTCHALLRTADLPTLQDPARCAGCQASDSIDNTEALEALHQLEQM